MLIPCGRCHRRNSRLKKLMSGLRSEFGGPEFEPHVTVLGTIKLTECEARDMFQKACEGLKPYAGTVDKVATGTFFYQCVFLLLHPTPEVVEASDHSCAHFGFKRSTRMPLFEFLPAQGSLESRGYIPLSSTSLVVLFMFSYVDSLRSYMPHLSLLYGDLTEEEKKTALEKACALDERRSEFPDIASGTV
ncbi:hypothetical protein SASPL_132669 [Salvia splendens]|uniref:Cyclic phosphodiesterase n=1 Tax=Salvia splendens TaxID=180675 RepID=A0A8X8ZHC5_SALSN|nr:hypothetical protein SASPL_132669 [Salvia splendens]